MGWRAGKPEISRAGAVGDLGKRFCCSLESEGRLQAKFLLLGYISLYS